MSTVVFDISMSLDGFMTAANPRPEEPMADALELARTTRRQGGIRDGWGDGHRDLRQHRGRDLPEQLPDRLGTPLLDAAREAFIQGIHESAMISVVGAIGLALFTAVSLRRKGVGSEPVVDQDPGETVVPEPAAMA